MTDLSKRVTVFVSTVGDEPNFSECQTSLDRQSVLFRREVVENVAPMSSAFQRMLDRCETEYYIQVDEDMHLWPNAVARLVARMEASPSSIAMVCGALWDCDVEHPIYGVKIYRHGIVKNFPYRDTFSCEKTQLNELRAAGFEADLLSLDSREDCFGEHGKYYTPRSIYVRWRRLMQKRILYRNQPGRNLPWVDVWPQRLLDRYLKTRDPLHLYALFGAIAGLTSPLPDDREYDYQDPLPDLALLQEYFGAATSGIDDLVAVNGVESSRRPSVGDG